MSNMQLQGKFLCNFPILLFLFLCNFPNPPIPMQFYIPMQFSYESKKSPNFPMNQRKAPIFLCIFPMNQENYDMSLLDSICRHLFNKLEFAQFGVHLQKLWQFR